MPRKSNSSHGHEVPGSHNQHMAEIGTIDRIAPFGYESVLIYHTHPHDISHCTPYGAGWCDYHNKVERERLDRLVRRE